MKVDDILKSKAGTEVLTVRPDEKVETFVHRLRLSRVGAMVVSDDGAKIAGIISERDVIWCLAENGAHALEKKVSEIMTHKVVTCARADTVAEVARLMTVNRIRHLPVTEDGRIAGMISIGDVVSNRLAEMELEANVLRDIAMAGH